MFNFRTAALTVCAFALASPMAAQEVNVYSYREPALIQPLMDGFTEQTGIAVNVAFLNKGMMSVCGPRANARRRTWCSPRISHGFTM